MRTIGPDYVKIRYDLLQQEYGVEDALAMGDGLASIAARTGYTVIIAGIEGDARSRHTYRTASTCKATDFARLHRSNSGARIPRAVRVGKQPRAKCALKL